MRHMTKLTPSNLNTSILTIHTQKQHFQMYPLWRVLIKIMWTEGQNGEKKM